MIDYTALTDQELTNVLDSATRESRGRLDRANIPAQIDEMNRRLLQAAGERPWGEWREPEGGAGAYPSGWNVAKDGKGWQSDVSGNTWEPGVKNWTEVALPDPTPEWVAPTGASSAYSIGPVVMLNGMKYLSLIDMNGWTPIGNPDFWEVISE